VYCREAHAIDSDRPTAISKVEQPISTEERRAVAQQFVEDMKLDIPALLDDINDTVGLAYASHPDRIYLVGKDGKIAFAGDKGPRGFKPELLEEAILKETGSGESESGRPSNAGEPGRGRGGAGGPGRRGNFGQAINRMPIVKALDSDGNSSLSTAEIEGATEALKTLDKNGDGKLTRDEMMPSRR